MTSKTTWTSFAIAFLMVLQGASTASAYYNPSSGRFLSRDPIMYPDGANTYAAWYVPSRMDPHGKQAAGDEDWTPPTGRRIWPPEWPVCPRGGGDWECAGDTGIDPDGSESPRTPTIRGFCGSFRTSIDATAIGPVVDDSLFASAGEILRRTNTELDKRFPINHSSTSSCTGMCCPLLTLNSSRNFTVGIKARAQVPVIGVLTVSLRVQITAVASGTIGVCVPKGCPCPGPMQPINLENSFDLSGIVINIGQVN